MRPPPASDGHCIVNCDCNCIVIVIVYNTIHKLRNFENHNTIQSQLENHNHNTITTILTKITIVFFAFFRKHFMQKRTKYRKDKDSTLAILHVFFVFGRGRSQSSSNCRALRLPHNTNR
jgi:hypothetical protein